MNEPLNADICARNEIKAGIIVFDIGGTWFRSALFAENNTLHSVCTVPAINYLNTPHTYPWQLQEKLVDYLIQQVDRLKSEFSGSGLNSAAIAMGAALHGETGYIWNSGPIWGPKCTCFDLMGNLRKKKPNINWTVVNDITASLIRNVSELKLQESGNVTVVTVSSGIGARTYNVPQRSVPIDSTTGLQGEIGHIPVDFKFRDLSINLMCDCGGINHLNAFCSGRGIEQVLPIIAKEYGESYRKSKLFELSQIDGGLNGVLLNKAVDQSDPLALEILGALTLPLARLLIALFTFEPLTQLVILTGGVALSLGDSYLNSLIQNLEQIGLYQITAQVPSFFRERITLGVNDDNSGLIGAGLISRARCGVTHGLNMSPKFSIRASLDVEYNVVKTSNVFKKSNSDFSSHLTVLGHQNGRAIVVMDNRVSALYASKICEYLNQHAIKNKVIVLRLREDSKSIQKVLQLVRELDSIGMSRKEDVLVAVGGGGLLDVVGLTARLYRRGVPHIKIPTTLLAIVDAAIGIKNAVNHNGYKSRLGSYYHPEAVFLDRTFIRTLSSRQVANGIAEIIKLALIKDAYLFELLEIQLAVLLKSKFQTCEYADGVIERAVEGMLEELAPNLWEKNLNRLVDFGHTFSPSIEMVASPKLLHGEAVAIDIAICCAISLQRKLLGQSDFNRVIALLREARLPITNSVCELALLNSGLADSTRHRGNRQRLPLPTQIGRAIFVDDVQEPEIAVALGLLKKVDTCDVA